MLEHDRKDPQNKNNNKKPLVACLIHVNINENNMETSITNGATYDIVFSFAEYICKPDSQKLPGIKHVSSLT